MRARRALALGYFSWRSVVRTTQRDGASASRHEMTSGRGTNASGVVSRVGELVVTVGSERNLVGQIDEALEQWQERCGDEVAGLLVRLQREVDRVGDVVVLTAGVPRAGGGHLAHQVAGARGQVVAVGVDVAEQLEQAGGLAEREGAREGPGSELEDLAAVPAGHREDEGGVGRGVGLDLAGVAAAAAGVAGLALAAGEVPRVSPEAGEDERAVGVHARADDRARAGAGEPD